MEKNNQVKVAQFISERIEKSGKLQKVIAEECCFNSPNVISMIKNGYTKLPLDKIGFMAKSLNIDSFELLDLCMKEYHPDTWSFVKPIIVKCIKSHLISANLSEILNLDYLNSYQ